MLALPNWKYIITDEDFLLLGESGACVAQPCDGPGFNS